MAVIHFFAVTFFFVFVYQKLCAMKSCIVCWTKKHRTKMSFLTCHSVCKSCLARCSNTVCPHPSHHQVQVAPRKDTIICWKDLRSLWIIWKSTQKCPGCGMRVEKRDGCSRMTCRCGTEFCYSCGNPWDHGCVRCQKWFRIRDTMEQVLALLFWFVIVMMVLGIFHIVSSAAFFHFFEGAWCRETLELSNHTGVICSSNEKCVTWPSTFPCSAMEQANERRFKEWLTFQHSRGHSQESMHTFMIEQQWALWRTERDQAENITALMATAKHFCNYFCNITVVAHRYSWDKKMFWQYHMYWASRMNLFVCPTRTAFFPILPSIPTSYLLPNVSTLSRCVCT